VPCVTRAFNYLFSQHRRTLPIRVIFVLTRSLQRIVNSSIRALWAMLRRRMIWLIMVFAVSSTSVSSPQDRNAGTNQTEMDVIVLVFPVSDVVAHVAVAYKHKVAHEVVVREAEKLATAIGGRITDVQIDDESAHPTNLSKYPVNTAASFLLSGCKQIKGRAPDLRSYLVGYQAWTHIEVVFALPTIEDYSGVSQLDSSDLKVTLIKEPDAYRYEVDIRTHKKDLPPLPENLSPSAETSHSSSRPMSDSAALPVPVKQDGVSASALSGSVCGAVVLLFIGMFLLRSRRTALQTRGSERTNM